jgi:hypothetical protein
MLDVFSSHGAKEPFRVHVLRPRQYLLHDTSGFGLGQRVKFQNTVLQIEFRKIPHDHEGFIHGVADDHFFHRDDGFV